MPLYLPTHARAPCLTRVPLKVHLEKKYGKGTGARMAERLGEAGERAGIKFNNERRVHNTIRSHRLVRLAHEQGKGDEMIETIFHAYFENGENIADADVLLELANKVCQMPPTSECG